MALPLTSPYRQVIVFSVTFLDDGRNLYDPTFVTLHIGSESFTYAANQIERVSEGVYSYDWLASKAGYFKRWWVGSDGDTGFYVESHVGKIKVLPAAS